MHSLNLLATAFLITQASAHSEDSDHDDHASHDHTSLAIFPKIDPRRINEYNNITRNKSRISASPNPDVTILSQNYFLCIWSYVLEDNSNPEQPTYSNEIYSNLFSMDTGKAQVSTEYLLNKLKGYSQDTPSATALFNDSNHATNQVAVVWESQIPSDSSESGFIDAVYGRVIKWSIRREGNTRYVRVTSTQSKEFQISSTTIDFLHHVGPDVVPIYGTSKFVVSWISQNADQSKNMMFFRIYHNSGKSASLQIQVHEADIWWKKNPRTAPLLNNVTLLTWLTHSSTDIIVYASVFNEDGASLLTGLDGVDAEGRFPLVTMTGDDNIYAETVPVLTHLHNDEFGGYNYFVMAWNARTASGDKVTMMAAVFAYSEEGGMERVSVEAVDLFDDADSGFDADAFSIDAPVMENVMNQQEESELGLDAQIAVCWSLKDINNDRSDVWCKMIEVVLWQEGEAGSMAEIYILSDAVMMNDETGDNHYHQFPSITSESSLRAQTDYSDDPEFVVAWGNSRENGFDVYSRILNVLDESSEINAAANNGDSEVIGQRLGWIIVGVVLGVVCVVLCTFVGHRMYVKHKHKLSSVTFGSRRKSGRRMQQLGDESDEDEVNGITAYGNGTVAGDDRDDDDDDDESSGDGVGLYTRKN